MPAPGRIRRTSLRKATERDVVWNFARAEFEVPEDGLRHTPPVISPDLKARLLRDERGGFSGKDWRELRAALLSTRADLLRPLFDLDVAWFLGDLPADRWPDVRVMNLRIFAPLAPTRRLEEFAAALDRGASWEGVPGDHYARRRASFDRAKMHGRPIVVADRPRGPYTLVEGTTRMAILLSKLARGEVSLSQVPVVLGVSPRIAQWEFF